MRTAQEEMLEHLIAEFKSANPANIYINFVDSTDRRVDPYNNEITASRAIRNGNAVTVYLFKPNKDHCLDQWEAAIKEGVALAEQCKAEYEYGLQHPNFFEAMRNKHTKNPW